MTIFTSKNYIPKIIFLYLLASTHHMTEEAILQENELVELAKKDVVAFGKLYDRYFEGIYGFVFRRTDDDEKAGDITSQVFLKALTNLRKYEFRGLPFSAWLYRIASNEVKKHYRSKGNKIIFSLEEERVRELIDENLSNEKEEHLNLLVSCLNELKTEVMEVLELRFFEDRNFKEIAYILNISESGAKMRTYRAIEKLKDSFNIKIRNHGEA